MIKPAAERRRARRLARRSARALLARDDPEHAAYFEGLALLRRAECDAALAKLRAHRRKDRSCFSTRLGEAVCLARLGRDGQARKAFSLLAMPEDLQAAVALSFELLGGDRCALYQRVEWLLGQAETAAALRLTKQLPRRRQGEYAARCYLELGQIDRALALVNEADDDHAAEILLAAGQRDRALPLFAGLGRGPRTSWFFCSGDDTKVYGYLGCARVLRRQKELTRAIRYVQHALDLDGSNAEALLLQAELLRALGLEPRAKAALRQLQRRHPSKRIRYDGLDQRQLEQQLGCVVKRVVAMEAGDEAFFAGRLDDAAAAYARMLPRRLKRLDQLTRAAVLRWAYTLAVIGRADEAAEVADHVSSIDAEVVTAIEIRCWALWQQGCRAEARALYRRCGSTCKQRDFFAAPAQRVLQHALASRKERAMKLVCQHGRHDLATRLFAQLSLPETDVEAQFMAGYAHLQLGQHKKALAFFERIIERRKNDSYWKQPADPWLCAIECLAALRRWRRLLAIEQRMMEIWRSSEGHDHFKVRALVHAAAAWHALSEPEQAEQELREALKLDLADREAIELMQQLRTEYRPRRKPRRSPQFEAKDLAKAAFAAQQQGDVERAVKLYRDAIEVHTDAETCGSLANVLTRSEAYDVAAVYYDLGLLLLAELVPEIRRGMFLSKLAWYHLKRDRFPTAAAIAKRAVQITNASGDWHTLAVAQLALGQNKAASESIDRGLQVDPRDPDLQQMLDARARESPDGRMVGDGSISRPGH